MNVAPVSFLTNTSSGKNNHKTKSNPSFGLTPHKTAVEMIDAAKELAKGYESSKFGATLDSFLKLLDVLMLRDDNLTLAIKTDTTKKGIDTFANASAYIYKTDYTEEEKVAGKPPHVYRQVQVKNPSMQGQTIFDVLLGLLADKFGKPIHPLRLSQQIESETAARAAGREIGAVVHRQAETKEITNVTPAPVLQLFPTRNVS